MEQLKVDPMLTFISRVIPALVGFSMLVGPNMVYAAPAGTLTCSLEPSTGQEKALACTYRPASGAPTAKLTGDIVRLGASDPLEAHRVLVWMVIGPANLDVADLGSTFVRKNPPPESLPKEFREGLIGGRDGQIALVPASGKEQVPGNAAVTVLELNLSAVRV